MRLGWGGVGEVFLYTKFFENSLPRQREPFKSGKKKTGYQKKGPTPPRRGSILVAYKKVRVVSTPPAT